MYDPQSLNRYTYCRNNPLKYTDPTGHWFGIDDTITGPVDEIVVLGILGIAAYGFSNEPAQKTLNSLTENLSGLFNETDTPRSNPISSDPGSVGQLDNQDGERKQDRFYGPDGYPEKDIDYDHDHGAGAPHAHDWSRPTDGSIPTHRNRGKGRPLSEQEQGDDIIDSHSEDQSDVTDATDEDKQNSDNE